MRTRKRRDPRMRQRTPGREKMPGRGFEVALVPRRPRQVGVEKVLGTGGFSVPRTFSHPCCLVLFRVQTSFKSSPWHLLLAWGPLPHPGVPSLPGPHHPGDSGVQMESRVQRWAARGTSDQGECVEAGDGAGMKTGTWARYCSELQTPCTPC